MASCDFRITGLLPSGLGFTHRFRTRVRQSMAAGFSLPASKNRQLEGSGSGLGLCSSQWEGNSEKMGPGGDQGGSFQGASSLYTELERYGLEETEYLPSAESSSSGNAANEGSCSHSTSFHPQSRSASRNLPGYHDRRQRVRSVRSVRSMKRGFELPVSRHGKETEAYSWSTETVDPKMDGWWVYCIVSGNRQQTFAGVSKNVERRILQHNGDLGGGPKNMRPGRPWTLLCKIGKFNGRSSAFQFDYRWKHALTAIVDDSPSSVNMKSVCIADRLHALEEIREGYREWEKLTIEWGDVDSLDEELVELGKVRQS